jgi:hypothetical protein
MELESELRQAMTEHVAAASAPRSLVTAVRRRHRRRVIRIRATVAVAAVAAAAIATVPVYQTVRAAPAGGPDPRTGVGPATVSTMPMPSAATPYPRSSPGRAEATVRPAPTRSAHGPGRGGARGPRAWVTFVPPGLDEVGSCVDQRVSGRPTTACRWAGVGGSAVEVRFVDDPGLVAPEDVISPAPMPGNVLTSDQVHGRPAVVTDTAGAVGTGGQVAWIERPGLGVVVLVTKPLRDQLLRIADGVRP